MNTRTVSTASFDRAVEDLTRCIASWCEGYVVARATILAVKSPDGWSIVSGQIFARMGASPSPPKVLETSGVVAFQADIPGGIDAVFGLLARVREGGLEIGGRRFQFPIENELSGHLEFLNPLGLRDGRRLTTLKIYGARRGGLFDRAKLDWELKAAEPPFDGLWDLLGEVGMPIPEGDMCSMDVVLLNVAEVAASSSVAGTKATLDVIMSPRLSPRDMRIGYKVFQHRNLVRRESQAGTVLAWQERDGMSVGRFELEVPEGAVLQVFLSYGHEAQQQYWMVDQNSLPNPRLSAYSLFDKDLEVLRDFLFESSQPRKNPQRDFEDGIAALLFILGFSNVNLGGMQRLQEAPDGLCCTPSGEYAIIECTTGHPDRDDKLSKLFTRALALRGTMDRVGLQQRKLLSVLVTALARNEIPDAELTKAAEMRILVLCKEDLEAAVQRAAFGENADRIYAQAIENLNVSGQLQLPGA